MKKKIVALSVVLFFVFSISLSAFAGSDFDLKVFHGEDDITVLPENNGQIVIAVDSMKERAMVTMDGCTYLCPFIVTTDVLDYYCFAIDFYSISKADINNIEFKIADKSYQFGKVKTNNAYNSTYGLYDETMGFAIDRYSVDFMEAFEAHQSEDIVLEMHDGENLISLTIPDDIKDAIIHLYKLYKLAGGTRQANLDNIWVYNNANTYKSTNLA